MQKRLWKRDERACASKLEQEKKMTAVMCDKGESARMKVKVLETVVGAAMCGLQTASVRKRQEEVAEMKMLSFSFGLTRVGRLRHEDIRGTWRQHFRCFGDKVREASLRWFGHIQRSDSDYTRRKMLTLELASRRPRGRPCERAQVVVVVGLPGPSAKEEPGKHEKECIIIRNQVSGIYHAYMINTTYQNRYTDMSCISVLVFLV